MSSYLIQFHINERRIYMWETASLIGIPENSYTILKAYTFQVLIRSIYLFTWIDKEEHSVFHFRKCFIRISYCTCIPKNRGLKARHREKKMLMANFYHTITYFCAQILSKPCRTNCWIKWNKNWVCVYDRKYILDKISNFIIRFV